MKYIKNARWAFIVKYATRLLMGTTIMGESVNFGVPEKRDMVASISGYTANEILVKELVDIPNEPTR